MDLMMLLPLVSIGVETFKRFIPTKYNKWANPLMAVVLGLGGSFATNGSAGLLTGIEAAVGAIGVYKIPKELGKKLGTEK